MSITVNTFRKIIQAQDANQSVMHWSICVEDNIHTNIRHICGIMDDHYVCVKKGRGGWERAKA
jgi:hypothetical protein